jgi:hypothetical protein
VSARRRNLVLGALAGLAIVALGTSYAIGRYLRQPIRLSHNYIRLETHAPPV